MLHGIKELRGFSVEGSDGVIGRVRDFYFDDQDWLVRFFVVDTGAWLQQRRVLIAPAAFGKVDWHARRLPVALTRERVGNSPDIDTQKPVSRQHEMEQYTYYGFPLPWGGPGVWRNGMPAGPTAAEQAQFVERQLQLQRERGDDPHLRGCDAVMRYHVHAIDGEIGHVDGLVVDDETWAIRYIIVNTSDWRLGHDVLVAPQWISDIAWLDATVTVGLTRRAIKDAPPYDRLMPPDRDHERRLYRHHGQPGYWTEHTAGDSETAHS